VAAVQFDDDLVGHAAKCGAGADRGSKNLPLTSVIPTSPCAPFQYHREFGTVDNPTLLVPGSYIVSVQATVNGKKVNQSVSFDVNTCGFNPNIVVKF
jgi:hypothetical protein